ncbi:MAG TPA: cytochrome c-type biogenesis protein CcmH [Solirubrobacteraceae bacterium]|nr:cytochrome c-type biogenesis protein CcmH [Solirubrobacteraceae bacterium]
MRALAALATLTATGAIGVSAATYAATPRASLPTIERRVMCVTCKIPLNVAESTQADRERAFVRGLIADGDSEAQIERALVSQYGPSVLALPSAHGFDLSAYLAPLVAMLALAATLALLLPRWRRHARAQAAGRSAADATSTLTPADRARLEADLARFDG